MKKMTIDELSQLNALLDDSLQHASKKQLATCIKLLGTSLAQLKIKYQVDDDQTAQNFYAFVTELEEAKPSDELNELAAKTVVECATALVVAKKGPGREDDKPVQSYSG